MSYPLPSAVVSVSRSAISYDSRPGKFQNGGGADSLCCCHPALQTPRRKTAPRILRVVDIARLEVMPVSLPTRLLLILVLPAGYLSLAVLGLNGISPFVHNPALTALAITLFVLSGAALFAGGNLSPGIREDRGNRWVIIYFGLIGLFAAFIPAWTDRHDILTIDGEIARWLGVGLFAAGGALRIWPVFVLGDRFSGLVAIQPGHTLVTRGVYGVIRHPSYLGLLVNSLGWALAFRSTIGILLTGLLVPALLARIRAEEKLLSSQFGSVYDAYRRRTSKLIPGIF